MKFTAFFQTFENRIDAILSGLSSMVADLREHAAVQGTAREDHKNQAADHLAAADKADTEASKANTVADKIEALING